MEVGVWICMIVIVYAVWMWAKRIRAEEATT
jgi:hypothetical protein